MFAKHASNCFVTCAYSAQLDYRHACAAAVLQAARRQQMAHGSISIQICVANHWHPAC
jgi:hypothetical protein